MKLLGKIKLGIIASIGLLTFSYSCTESESANTDTETVERIRPVRVASLEKKEIARTVRYNSNLQAFDEIYIAPANPGRIVKIHADIGDRVNKGDLLLEMDPTQLNQAILQLNNLEKDFERFDSLISFGGIPKQQYDQMKTQLEVTKQNVEFLETNTKIRAPFSGVITDRLFESGELFGGAPNTQVGKAAVLVLQRINPIKAVIAVSEKHFPNISKDIDVNIKADIYPDKEFKGEIYKIHPTINPMTKTFNVEVRVPNSKELLRPGMFARVDLNFGFEPSILVQSNVVLQQLGTNQRFVFLKENGTARRVVVNIGSRFDDYLEILSDEISEGDEIVISGHSSLLDGEKIEVVN